jgi:hypothetical protein
MSLMANSSVMYAIVCSLAPQLGHFSGFEMSRAQLAEPLLFLAGLSSTRFAPGSFAARSPRTRLA